MKTSDAGKNIANSTLVLMSTAIKECGHGGCPGAKIKCMKKQDGVRT